MKKFILTVAFVLMAGGAAIAYFIYSHGASDGFLRGSVQKSNDHKTYLAVDDDNGGACKPLLVDGGIWPHALKAVGLVAAGSHTISCGTDTNFRLEFEIPEGMVFHFDYWGP